jgi:hypothetical protein
VLQKEIEETSAKKGDKGKANLESHLVVVYQSLMSRNRS